MSDGAGAVPPPGAAGAGPARSVTTAILVTMASALPLFLFGGLAVLMQVELGFSEAGIGLAVASFSLAATLTSVPSGRLGERLGSAGALAVAAALSVLSLTALGLVSNTLAHVALFLAIAGVANAIAQPAANLAIARKAPPSRRGLLFGAKQSAMPAAALLGGFAVPLLGLTVGWRWAFTAAAVLAGLLLLTVPRERPLGPPVRTTVLRSGGTPTKRLVVLALASACGGASAQALAAFLVVSSVDRGLATGSAGYLLAFGSATGIVARLVIGWWADRRTGGHLKVVAALFVVGTAGYLLLALATLPLLIVLGTVLSFAGGWGWSGLFNFAIVLQNPKAPAAATGVTQTGTHFGAVVGPLIFGALATAVSFRSAWLFLAGITAAAAVLTLTGRWLLVRDASLGRPRS